MDLIKEIQERNEPVWLLEKRRQALEAFRRLASPNMRYGLDIRMDFAGLDLDAVRATKCPDIKIPEMPDGVTAMAMSRALAEMPEIMGKYFMRSSDISSKFSALHWSLWNRGMVIVIEKGIKDPLHFVIEAPASANVFENMLVVMEPNSSATILESLSGSPSFRSGVTEIICGEGASIKFGSLQSYSGTACNYSVKRALACKDSKIDWVTLDMGSSRTLSEVSSVLAGTGAESKTVGMYFGNAGQQFNFQVNSTHVAPDTVSDMVTKGALNDSSKVIYRGLVRIEKNAMRSNGYQTQETLLLSEDAEADPVPNLEIENNDVRCSHGTTVGHVDIDRLFYMMSRGLSEAESKKRIVEGFFEPVIEKIPLKAMESDIRNLISRKVEEIR